MEQKFNVIRGSKTSEINIGVTTTGNSRLYFEDTEVNEEGLKTRWFFKNLYIDTTNDGLGEVNLIRTEWRKATLSPVGNIILGTESTEWMITNEADIKSFISMFGFPILMSMANGLVRSVWGFNNLPIFNTTNGSVKIYTEEEENSEPTNNY